MTSFFQQRTWLKTRFFVECLVLCLALQTEVHAQHSTTSANEEPTNKILLGAKKFAEEFLKRDADPTQVFFMRDVLFPAWKDQPVLDCEVEGFVRWIKPQLPYFENKRQDVVIVPIVAELLMVIVGGDGSWGSDTDEEKRSWCKWDYERFNFQTGKFETLSQFRTRLFRAEFVEWGESYLGYAPKGQENRINRHLSVAIARENRLIRYHLRLKLRDGKLHQISPQVPRHWFAIDAAKRLNFLQQDAKKLIETGISDREPTATGDVLQRDLTRMRYQFVERAWKIEKLNHALAESEIDY